AAPRRRRRAYPGTAGPAACGRARAGTPGSARGPGRAFRTRGSCGHSAGMDRADFFRDGSRSFYQLSTTPRASPDYSTHDNRGALVVRPCDENLLGPPTILHPDALGQAEGLARVRRDRECGRSPRTLTGARHALAPHEIDQVRGTGVGVDPSLDRSEALSDPGV